MKRHTEQQEEEHWEPDNDLGPTIANVWSCGEEVPNYQTSVIFHRPVVSPPPCTIERGLVAAAVDDYPKGGRTSS
eukprot:11194058-Lingulodinium_polyedra.AAC.1